jgi:hypothetical protein
MTEEEIQLLKNTVGDMELGKLTRREKILFVLGIQSGMFADNKVVKGLLNKVADVCLNGEDDLLKQVTEFKD